MKALAIWILLCTAAVAAPPAVVSSLGEQKSSARESAPPAVIGMPVKQARKIPVLAAGLVGLNADHPLGSKAMEMCLDAAHKEVGFFSPRPEQSALSMVAYILKMS